VKAAALAFALALSTAALGCGSGSPLASMTPTIGTATPPASSSDASGTVTIGSPSDSAVPKDVAPARTGVLVVAVGKIAFTEDASGRSYTEGGSTALAARSLAKLIYKRKELRPDASEEIVQTLAGDPPPERSKGVLGELADLRSNLTEDTESAASKALLLALSQKVRARAFVLVGTSVDAKEKPPTAKLVRVDDVSEGPPLVRSDAATFAAVAPEEPSTEYKWPNVDDAVTALLGPSLPAPIAPHKVGLPGATADAKALPGNTGAPAQKKDEKDKPITEKPWFWGVLGGLAAVGVAGLVVSQTVNTSSGTVQIKGKVLP